MTSKQMLLAKRAGRSIQACMPSISILPYYVNNEMDTIRYYMRLPITIRVDDTGIYSYNVRGVQVAFAPKLVNLVNYTNGSHLYVFCWGLVLNSCIHSFNALRPRQIGRHFQTHFLQKKLLYFDENSIQICSPWSNWQYSTNGSDNG